MTYEEVIEHFGSEVLAAEGLGFTRQAVNLWKTNGIQPRTQELIQMKTRGKLKSEEK